MYLHVKCFDTFFIFTILRVCSIIIFHWKTFRMYCWGFRSQHNNLLRWLRRDQEPAGENVGSRCRGWRTVPCVGLSRILSSPTSCAMDRLSGLQIQMLTLSLESMEAGKAAFCKVHNTSSLFYHFPEYQDWYWVSWLTASTPRDTASCRTLSGEEQTKLKSR